MAGNSTPLDDEALNSELEALLAVQPSAGFNARVLAEATRRPPWTLSWQIGPAGALAVALAIALVIHFRSAGPTTVPLTGRPFASPIHSPPQLRRSRQSQTDPISVASDAAFTRRAGPGAQGSGSVLAARLRARRHRRIPRPGLVVPHGFVRCRWRRPPTTARRRCLPMRRRQRGPTARAVTGYRSAPAHSKTLREESAHELSVHLFWP